MGKLNRPKVEIIDADLAPLCACGCLKHVTWNKYKKRWNVYLYGHNQRGVKVSEETIRKHQLFWEDPIQRANCIALMKENYVKDPTLRLRVGVGGKRKHPPEEIEIVRQAHLGWHQTAETIERIRIAKTGTKATEETRRKMSIAQGGNGQLDDSCMDYEGFTHHLRNLIRDRDGRRCKLCTILEKDCKTQLDVHHIDYDKKNYDPDNLIALCKSCHAKTNTKRSVWTSFFQSHRKLILIQEDRFEATG